MTPGHKKFCGDCGAAQTEDGRCPNCGTVGAKTYDSIPPAISQGLNMLAIYCSEANVMAEVRAGSIWTLDFGLEKLVTIVPMTINFTANNSAPDFHYLKLWVPLENLSMSDNTDDRLTTTFELGAYPAEDGELPGSRWPAFGSVGMVNTYPLSLEAENAGINFRAFAEGAFNLLLSAMQADFEFGNS